MKIRLSIKDMNETIEKSILRKLAIQTSNDITEAILGQIPPLPSTKPAPKRLVELEAPKIIKPPYWLETAP